MAVISLHRDLVALGVDDDLPQGDQVGRGLGTDRRLVG
jgi:hypothetical protein